MNIHYKLPSPSISEKAEEEGPVKILNIAKSSVFLTLEERKREASKPIYLVRYE